VAELWALEGIDGSGKGTQAARLRDALVQSGRRCELLSFPQYEATRFGRRIGDFLNGRYGALDQVHPVLVSLLFAGDRLESRPRLLEAMQRNDIVLCDRYVPSNIAHQAAKSRDEEQADLIAWIEFVEYDLYQLPRADRVFWLDMPVPQAQELIARKQRRSYTERSADLQEADAAYLARVREVYARLAVSEPGWQRIEGCRGGEIRSTDEIATEIAAAVGLS
jgi:dTMP kinase